MLDFDIERVCARNLENSFQNEWLSTKIPINLTRTCSPSMAAEFSRTLPGFLMVGNEAGEVVLVTTTNATANPKTIGEYKMTELHAYPDPIFDIAWRDNIYALAIADNHVYLHDDTNNKVVQCLGYHNSNVRTVKFKPTENNIIATAGRDGCIALWDLRLADTNSVKNSPISVLNNVHTMTTLDKKTSVVSSSVTAFEFMPLDDHLIASIGQPDYSIKFWDIRYTWGKGQLPRPYQEIAAPQSNIRPRAFVSLCTDSIGSSIFAVSSDNHIYRYATSNCSSTPIDTFSAPGFRTSGSFYTRSCLSPNDEYLLCGATEGHAYIWPNNSQRNSAIKLAEHRYEVSCVAWSPFNDLLFVGGEDYTSRIWSRIDKNNMTMDNNHDSKLLEEDKRYVRAEPLSISSIKSKKSNDLFSKTTSHCEDGFETPSSMLTIGNHDSLPAWPSRSRPLAINDIVESRVSLAPLSTNRMIVNSPTTPMIKRQTQLDAFFTPSPKSSRTMTDLKIRNIMGNKENQL